MTTPSYQYGTTVQYVNDDGSTTELVSEPPSTGSVCNGCVFQGTGRCHQAPKCGCLIWKEAV